jgi:hypothetical protein
MFLNVVKVIFHYYLLIDAILLLLMELFHNYCYLFLSQILLSEYFVIHHESFYAFEDNFVLYLIVLEYFIYQIYFKLKVQHLCYELYDFYDFVVDLNHNLVIVCHIDNHFVVMG